MFTEKDVLDEIWDSTTDSDDLKIGDKVEIKWGDYAGEIGTISDDFGDGEVLIYFDNGESQMFYISDIEKIKNLQTESLTIDDLHEGMEITIKEGPELSEVGIPSDVGGTNAVILSIIGQSGVNVLNDVGDTWVVPLSMIEIKEEDVESQIIESGDKVEFPDDNETYLYEGKYLPFTGVIGTVLQVDSHNVASVDVGNGNVVTVLLENLLLHEKGQKLKDEEEIKIGSKVKISDDQKFGEYAGLEGTVIEDFDSIYYIELPTGDKVYQYHKNVSPASSQEWTKANLTEVKIGDSVKISDNFTNDDFFGQIGTVVSTVDEDGLYRVKWPNGDIKWIGNTYTEISSSSIDSLESSTWKEINDGHDVEDIQPGEVKSSPTWVPANSVKLSPGNTVKIGPKTKAKHLVNKESKIIEVSLDKKYVKLDIDGKFRSVNTLQVFTESTDNFTTSITGQSLTPSKPGFSATGFDKTELEELRKETYKNEKMYEKHPNKPIELKPNSKKYLGSFSGEANKSIRDGKPNLVAKTMKSQMLEMQQPYTIYRSPGVSLDQWLKDVDTKAAGGTYIFPNLLSCSRDPMFAWNWHGDSSVFLEIKTLADTRAITVTKDLKPPHNEWETTLDWGQRARVDEIKWVSNDYGGKRAVVSLTMIPNTAGIAISDAKSIADKQIENAVKDDKVKIKEDYHNNNDAGMTGYVVENIKSNKELGIHFDNGEFKYIPYSDLEFQETNALKLPKTTTPTPLVYTKISGALGGSGSGGVYQDQYGKKSYIKSGKIGHTQNEWIAGELYRKAGIHFPNTEIITHEDKLSLKSDWLEDLEPMTVEDMRKNKDVREGFVVDAWLGNWDAVGTGANNMMKGKNGKVYRIESGGALLFRAMGKPKQLDDHVSELDTIRDPSISPEGSAVFKNMKPEELKAGALKIMAFTDEDIDNIVSQSGFESATFLADKLKKRRDAIIKKYITE